MKKKEEKPFMRTFPKPVVVTSRCFEFDACRYNGQMIPNKFVEILEPWAEFRPVCPELETGPAVPRDPGPFLLAAS